MRRNRTYRKVLSLLLCVVLLLGCLSGCDSNIASTIRLEKTQGTVGVEDEKNVRIEVREGMQLYSGYEVGTAEVSQAWIGLDDTKSVKMDANTVALVSLAGKDLKVTLEAGKLFFNVSAPLAEDESFTIETATMVTGIRGTSGWVEVVDEYTTRVVILEGSVEVQTLDPATGKPRIVTVTGGQILTAVYHGDAMGHGSEDSAIQGMIGSNFIIAGNIVHTEVGLRIEELMEENVLDFVREEVAQSQQIQQKITENSPLSVPEILEAPEADVLPPEQSSAEEQPAEDAVPDAPQDTVEEPNVEEEAPEEPPVQDPPVADWAATPPNEDTVTRVDGPVETEVYYERVVVEDSQTELVYPEGSTATGSSDGTSSNTGGGTGENTGGGTGGDSGSSGSTTVKPDNTTTYRPLIQLLPSEENPEYAVVTHANEVTTYTQDDNGNITVKTDIVPMEGVSKETVFVNKDNWTITFNKPNDDGTVTPMTIQLEEPPET